MDHDQFMNFRKRIEQSMTYILICWISPYFEKISYNSSPEILKGKFLKDDQFNDNDEKSILDKDDLCYIWGQDCLE